MEVYTVNYCETIYSDPLHGSLGVFSSLEKAQAAILAAINEENEEILKEYESDLEDLEDVIDDEKEDEEEDGCYQMETSEWIETSDRWTLWAINDEGFGYEYTITKSEVQ